MKAGLKNKRVAENVIQLMELLKKASDERENMSEKEKKDNAIKMGDIYY